MKSATLLVALSLSAQVPFAQHQTKDTPIPKQAPVPGTIGIIMSPAGLLNSFGSIIPVGASVYIRKRWQLSLQGFVPLFVQPGFNRSDRRILSDLGGRAGVRFYTSAQGRLHRRTGVRTRWYFGLNYFQRLRTLRLYNEDYRAASEDTMHTGFTSARFQQYMRGVQACFGMELYTSRRLAFSMQAGIGGHAYRNSYSEVQSTGPIPPEPHDGPHDYNFSTVGSPGDHSIYYPHFDLNITYLLNR